jgi:GNAT superfamily N-acetyltransferase
VIRNDKGCVVGGARVHVNDNPEFPVSIDVAIDPRHRRKGYATRLYEALNEAGVDVELGSDTSMKFRTMTKMGYAFMVGRRTKKAQRGDERVP